VEVEDHPVRLAAHAGDASRDEGRLAEPGDFDGSQQAPEPLPRVRAPMPSV
jgi:hypothetical protein